MRVRYPAIEGVGDPTMSTTTEQSRPQVEKSASPQEIPPLENGDTLTRAEFERRYDAMPNLKKAELIEGVVYVPSPVSHSRHGKPHLQISTWLGIYLASTPGTEAGDNGSIRMDLDNMPQPDAYLFILPKHGGQARISEDDYVEGAPELIAEVASTSASYDLHAKLNMYRCNGVREYVVWRVRQKAIDWFVSREGQFEPLPLARDGIYKSSVFPGLWLDPAALVRGDLTTVFQILQQGIATPEHAEFVARLQQITAG
jgi:Uma2 family endonuclease